MDYLDMLRQHEEQTARIRGMQAEYEAQQQAIHVMCEMLATFTSIQTLSMAYLALNPNFFNPEPPGSPRRK